MNAQINSKLLTKALPKNKNFNKTLALAGIFQSTFLVHQIAFNQTVNPTAFNTMIESIFKISTPDTLSVYGELKNLQLGLLLIHQNTPAQSYRARKMTLRYIFSLSRLAKKILSNPKIFEQLKRRLTPITSQAQHLGAIHESVLTELSSLYKQIFITRNLQVPIFGKKSAFQNSLHLKQIYALIIAGIRSAVLWHQLGGSKLELFFSQSKLKKQAAYLLDHSQLFSPTSNA